MKKLSQITESVWGDIRKKSLGENPRLETGKKVKTCLGVDVIVRNITEKYDELIKDMLSRTRSGYDIGILSPRDLNLSPEEMKNVRDWSAPYKHLIYDGQFGTSLIANYYTYEEITDWDEEFKEEFSEDDYMTICKCVSTKLKEIGDCFEYVPQNKDVCVIGEESKLAEQYEGEEQFGLVDEGTVFSWECSQEGEYGPIGSTYLDDFKESIIYEFPELEDEVFLFWSFGNQGVNIAIPMNVNNVMNIRKYVEFTKKWFAS